MDRFLCVMAGYDERTERYLAGIQNTLYQKGYAGTHTKYLPQHITLGTFACSQKCEAIALVKAAAESVPFSVSINHIGIFEESKVLFVAPDINRELLTLKERFGNSSDWTPHTTMLIDEPEVIYSAISDVASGFHAFKGRIEYLYLYEFWPTRHILTLKLDNDKNAAGG